MHTQGGFYFFAAAGNFCIARLNDLVAAAYTGCRAGGGLRLAQRN